MSRYRKRIARITHAHTHTTHKPVQHGHYCFTSVNNIVTVIPLTYTHVQVILLTKVYPWTFFTSRTLIVFISFWHHLFSVRDERLESFLSESHFCWQSTTLVHIYFCSSEILPNTDFIIHISSRTKPRTCNSI